jgi:DNA-binding NtrC family response regulator
VLNTGAPIRSDELRPWFAADRIQARAAILKPEPVAAGATLEAVERQLIETTLAQHDGHRAKTAEALGIGLRTLSGKLRQYGYAPREKNFAKAG